MARGDDFLASITRIAPQATIDPGDEDESPSQPEAIAAAVAAAVANLPVQRPQLVPVPTDVDGPDLAPLLEAFERSRLEPSALGEAIGAAVLAAFEGQADTVPALEAIVKQLEVMSKRFSGVVAGGGGGGPTEVGLRTGPDGSVVSPMNPLSVSMAGGGLVPGVDYDLMTPTYPNATTEVYAYTLNGDPVQTVTVTYTNVTKDVLDGVAWS